MNQPATIPDEHEIDLLPGLTELQTRFVHQMLTDPSCRYKAAVRAGYSRTSAHVIASRLMRNPLVAKALMEGATVQLAAHAVEAVKVQVQLMRTAKSELVREKASAGILDRVGMVAPQQHRVSGSLSIRFDLGE